MESGITSVRCKLGNEAFNSCPVFSLGKEISGDFTSSLLAEGDYTLSVQLVDKAGNTTGADYTFKIIKPTVVDNQGSKYS